MVSNSSIIQDEVLSHRMGLIPIKADARKLDYVVDNEETDRDTIVFHLNVECTEEQVTSKSPTGTIQTKYKNESVLSGHLQWLEQGEQHEVFPGMRYDHRNI